MLSINDAAEIGTLEISIVSWLTFWTTFSGMCDSSIHISLCHYHNEMRVVVHVFVWLTLQT
jgi:hypothetical protein